MAEANEDTLPPNHNDDSISEHLPKTCTVIEKNSDREVYVVGTAHFSKESQEDVALAIRTVQPHVIFLELCRSRLGILQLDEERLLEESKDISAQKVRSSIQQYGPVQGIMQILLLRMSAELTKKLGMAPGGEFRRAFQEAQKIPHARLVYGDRPISITLQRAIGSLSFFQKIRFAWHLITSDVDFSAEDIEKCKDKDMLEQLLSEMSKEFPSLSKVFVDERDIYLAHSIKRSTGINLGSEGHYTRPVKVIAVLGIGHVNGVVKNWDKDLGQQAKQVMEIPPPTVAGTVASFMVRGAILGGSVYLSFLAGRKIFRVAQSFLYPRMK